jgi:hypothetical protein
MGHSQEDLQEDSQQHHLRYDFSKEGIILISDWREGENHKYISKVIKWEEIDEKRNKGE